MSRFMRPGLLWSRLLGAMVFFAPLQDVAAQTAKAPPLGDYFCTQGAAGNHGPVFGLQREFTLKAGGIIQNDDETGTYRYDPETGKLAFEGGVYGDLGGTGSFIGGASNQIDIDYPDGYWISCSLQ